MQGKENNNGKEETKKEKKSEAKKKNFGERVQEIRKDFIDYVWDIMHLRSEIVS